jgi:5-methyltetrahydrofolate--homocysteine methyltransferase
MHPEKRSAFAATNRDTQRQLVESFQGRRKAELVPYREAIAGRFQTDWDKLPIATPAFTGTRVLDDHPLDELAGYIDWSPMFWAWEMRGKYPRIFDNPKYGDEARKLYNDARDLLDEIVQEGLLRAWGVYGFWPAVSMGDDIVVFHDQTRQRERLRIPTLRQQWLRKGRDRYFAMADFVAPLESGKADFVGAFATTGGIGAAELAARFEAEHDDYRAIMVKVLAERLAEAFAERLHEMARVDWGFGQEENLSVEEMLKERYRGIRPAPGYPSCPDHTLKRSLFDLLEIGRAAPIVLSETCMMIPEASVCGLYFSHPQSQYFGIGKITRDQVKDYARRQGMPVEEVERWLAANLAYEPGPD